MERRVVVLVGLAASALLFLQFGTGDLDRPAPKSLIAERAYECRLNGKRSSVLLVEWSWADYEGRRVVRDITRTRSRTARMMGREEDVFESNTRSTIFRTEDGDLLQMEELSVQGGREDRTVTRRTATGYEVTVSVNGNEERFEIETPGPTKVDVEAYLGGKIRAGEVQPGGSFEYRVLAPGRRTSLPVTARIEEHDDVGPGLRVRVQVEGRDSLWWFAPDGSVMRVHLGETIIRRADELKFEDLPRRPAAYSITLPANVDLPRIFTARSMIVDVEVSTDETLRPPKIEDNPYTEVVEESEHGVRLRLRSFDSPGVNVSLPIATAGFEEHLKRTPVMETDDPALQAIVRRILARHKDARGAAAAIADFVFAALRKGSSTTAEPTATQILRDGGGDCSEHALLFTALCRAAGIPARRCSGYVCIGSDWGAHAWSEIWVGAWIGADPTTNEIGTRARYIFCGRPDDPGSRYAEIRAGRTRIRIRNVELSDGSLEIGTGKAIDREVFTGIRLGKLPDGWRIDPQGALAPGRFIVSKTVCIEAIVEPDHGYRSIDLLLDTSDGFRRTKFGGRDAIVRTTAHNTSWLVPLGRENLWVMATATGAVPKKRIVELFQPTLSRDDS